MVYKENFELHLLRKDTHKLAVLWDEFLRKEELSVNEVVPILKMFKESSIAQRLGTLIEKGGNLLGRFSEDKDRYEILKYIIDLQNSNSPHYAKLAEEALQNRYGKDPKFHEKFRLIGLREGQDFKGAISNFELLNHMDVGQFVFHTGGWGTGEILDVSWLLEEVTLEFEYIAGKKHFSFKSAFKNLIPLPKKHFLARRFGNPDALETEAKKDPVSIIKMLIRDLGPKTAVEIKDELFELVIPEKDWAKWWQNARGKLKKDAEIFLPKSLKDPIELLSHSMTPTDRLNREFVLATNPKKVLEVAYNFMRDFPSAMKEESVKNNIKEKLQHISPGELSLGQNFEKLFLQQDLEDSVDFSLFLEQVEDITQVLAEISILSLKKRFLSLLKNQKENWTEQFCALLLALIPNQLRDWILHELISQKADELLKKCISSLLENASNHPHAFVWYFQKVIHDGSELPCGDIPSKLKFFEAILALLSTIEFDEKYKELTKKIYSLLTEKRYLLVREIFELSTIAQIKEFLLLLSKCQSLTKQDQKIFISLAEVVYPELSSTKQIEDPEVIWTTKEGYEKIQKRIKHIAEHEIVENSKEIAEARGHGDLKENSEYKYAQEKKARLQAELKMLLRQFQKARIITPDDIAKDEISVGAVVKLEDDGGEEVTFSLLGPWDADPEKNILSFQSRFAEAMMGKKKGESVSFKDKTYVVKQIATCFES